MKQNEMMRIFWFEELPALCPPSDAEDCHGTYYRVAADDPANTSDFFSQRKMAPDKVFTGKGIDECIVRSVSLFAELEDAVRLLKLPKFRKAKIAELTLGPRDGKIKKTFGRSHHSWWRSICFDASQAKIIKP